MPLVFLPPGQVIDEYALEPTTMSASPSLSTSATSGYSLSVPLVLQVSNRTVPVAPS